MGHKKKDKPSSSKDSCTVKTSNLNMSTPPPVAAPTGKAHPPPPASVPRRRRPSSGSSGDDGCDGLCRSERAEWLEYYSHIVEDTICKFQNPQTGLIPGCDLTDHAWIRDNVYCISSVWALSLAYKRYTDTEQHRVMRHKLEITTRKCIRGLMTSMMRQRDRLEKFKESFNPKDSIHAKFSASTGLPVVGDEEWGHLQIDAISLFLLTLAQMTASGLQLVFSLDEVAFVQNLVFFIETAYCTPDYGIWERGDKSNTGIVELNASSIGMAKAALEAITNLDLFGSEGGPASVIHVMADEVEKCNAVLLSMLPRESLSKETDAALLTVIGYPAFAVDKEELIQTTLEEILTKLGGNHGCKRFLRDGYRNPREDSSRLHYEPWELRLFENTESQWPLFLCYLVIHSCFQDDMRSCEKYTAQLSKLMVQSSDQDYPMMPELYIIPEENATAEEANPGSQVRIPNGRLPFRWAQSLWVIGKLLQEGFIAPGELDPTNRRLSAIKRPDVIVQVVVIAKDQRVKDVLSAHGLDVPLLGEGGPVEVHPARVLSHLFSYLGRNEKLGLSGRKSGDVGILTTSRLYKIQNKLFAFMPQRFDTSRNYMDCDLSLMMNTLEYGLTHLSTSWTSSGRPTITLILGSNMLENGQLHPSMKTMLRKLKNGYISGTRVNLGRFDQFLSTSCICNMSFLHDTENGQPDRLFPSVEQYLTEKLGRPVYSYLGLMGKTPLKLSPATKKKFSVRGSIKRSRSLKSVNEAVPAVIERKDSLEEDMEESLQFSQTRQKAYFDAQYGCHELDEVLVMLAEAQSLEEQGDILHYLVQTYGLSFTIKVPQTNDHVQIKDLLRTLYEKAIEKRNWGLVRHSAGFLGKRVEDLSKSVTDLLVRQKQVTVGMPPHHEVTLSGGKLTSGDLRQVIHKSYGEDVSMAMLTQELLVYLGMFAQTEEKLFHGMLRLRIGLIIQVMATELARCLKLSEEDATDDLLNLSPFEMRNLLHHLMAGEEFTVEMGTSGYCVQSEITLFSKHHIQSMAHSKNSSKDGTEKDEKEKSGEEQLSCISTPYSRRSFKVGAVEGDEDFDRASSDSPDETEDEDDDRRCSWIRRRRVDGALNRVPLGFYAKIWHVLEKAAGISMQGNMLDFALTQEMTSNELKFALRVEGALNTIPQPEFRQLMVEALMVLSLIIEYNVVAHLGGCVRVDDIVRKANQLFLVDQFAARGNATLCCATDAEGSTKTSVCGGAAGICRHFYDTAPSGSFGSMTYLVRSVCEVLDCVPDEGEMDCQIS